MSDLIRRSPISFDAAPAQTIKRGGWEVVLTYEDEGSGNRLVDLSHKSKWDVQDGDIESIKPFGLDVPADYNACNQGDGMIVNRMNRTQAAVWQLGEAAVEAPTEAAYTETTDAQALIALFGPDAPAIAETVTGLDLFPPQAATPRLVQGPVLHIPCQIVVLKNDGLLIAFSRGYGQTMAEALLESGKGWGLSPAGEKAFSDWLAG